MFQRHENYHDGERKILAISYDDATCIISTGKREFNREITQTTRRKIKLDKAGKQISLADLRFILAEYCKN